MKSKSTLLTRGQLAKETGVHLETLRYYETQKLFPAPERSGSGYRIYTQEHVDRVRFIQRAQELGFTLREVQELFSLRTTPARSSRDVKCMAESKLQDIQRRIVDLKRMERRLREISNACTGTTSTRECPILLSLDGVFKTKDVPAKKGKKS